MKLPWRSVPNLSPKVQEALRYLEESSAADYSRREEVVVQLGGMKYSSEEREAVLETLGRVLSGSDRKRPDWRHAKTEFRRVFLGWAAFATIGSLFASKRPNGVLPEILPCAIVGIAVGLFFGSGFAAYTLLTSRIFGPGDSDNRAIDDIRATAAQSIGKIGGLDALELLLPYLEDKDGSVRRLVGFALSSVMRGLEDEPGLQLGIGLTRRLARSINEMDVELSRRTLLLLKSAGSSAERVRFYFYPAPSREIEELARETADALAQRAEENRERETLLRSADTTRQTLLTPASAAGPSDESMLLRVEEADE